MADFYDGTKLLSLKDLNGNQPDIYMCTSNRSAGKTTYFSRYVVNRFLKHKNKFALLYRYNYELDDCAEKFYKDINELFFHGTTMTSKRRASGIFHELFIDEEACGYAISINSADEVKKYSHLFSDIDIMLFDEFQSESNHYCPQEVRKFISVHTSVARGGGKQIRRVPVIMISNPVSILNPYYIDMGISARLTDKVKFLRGDGFVLEQGFNDVASRLQKESAFNRAFANNTYVNYASEAIYLNDNKTFIGKPEGKSRYLVTIRYNGCDYAVRSFDDDGIIYCDDKADLTFPQRIAITTDDHCVNYILLKKNDMFFMNMKYYFEHGCFRFKDLKCKEALMTAISY